MKLNRCSADKPWPLTESFKPNWRQRLAIFLGRTIEVRFLSPDSKLTAACQLSWKLNNEGQWHDNSNGD